MAELRDDFDWGSFLANLATVGLDVGRVSNNTYPERAATAARMADPWGENRQQYVSALNDFMKDPGAATFNDPAFQSSLNLGLENVSRQAGAAGMSLSGNRLADLQRFGQSFGYAAEQNRFNQLARLSGLDVSSPRTAAEMYLGGQQSGDNTIADILSHISGRGGQTSLLSQLPGALGSLFNLPWSDLISGFGTDNLGLLPLMQGGSMDDLFGQLTGDPLGGAFPDLSSLFPDLDTGGDFFLGLGGP